ncbi:MAG: HAMP domain-containing histidine kinase [Verrucomicrobia bacterium]|nr:HAMP domain-containing histidine kinase [Verrucomicrobiota bacterium]
MAWALAYHRIFNTRQVLAAVSHRFATVGLLVGSGWGLSRYFATLMPEAAAWSLGVFLCGLLVVWLDEQSRILLGLGDGMILAAFRSEVLHASRQEAGKGRLVEEFEQLLCHHFTAPAAAIMVPTESGYSGNGVSLSRSRPAFAALCSSSWITPESLQRRRYTLGHEDLSGFLSQHAIGAMVTVPRGSSQPVMLVAVSTKSNEWPFTYPEVQRLQNVAELMESILIRSQLTDQAAMQAKMEHLAIMSRGLAHDLKNLLTPVSAFLVHTEGRYENGTVESEVHASARRSARMMADYLRETLFFSERLEPKFERVEMARIFARVRDATAARARNRGVLLATENHLREPLTADQVLIQRLLANLVGNAIDASTGGRSVSLRAAKVHPGWVQLQVVDSGHGIASDAMDRIFDPYFTTKDMGADVRGMGLGLAISQRIVHLHRGTIVVNSTPGVGTTVVVDLPMALRNGHSTPAPSQSQSES